MSEKMNRLWQSITGLPRWVQVWVMILATTNMASLLFLDTDIGFWSAVAFFGVVSGLNMPMMFIQGGLTRALSFPHLIWVPLLVYIYPSIIGPNALDPASPVFQFGVAIVVVNGISLLFDFMECVRWLKGGREVLGLET